MENISKLTPILYEKNETNFNHNGLGKLTKLLVNEIDEVLNGEFEAFFEYPANGRLADKIDNEMFIKAKPNKKDDPHIFKVYDYELDTFTQTYLIYARSKNIEDLKNNVILDVNVKSLAPTQAWNLAKNNALDPVVTTFYSDIATMSSVHWERRSLLSTIAGQEGSMIQYWGGEIKHDINRISLLRRRGQDNVTTVRHGKNLDGLKATYSTKGLVTAIVPYYIKGDDKAVYGDVVESQYINNYPSTYYDIIEYNDEALGLSREDEPESGYSDSTIKTALNKAAKRYFDENIGKDLPSINMEISLEDISQTKEYEQFKDFEQIEIGDTITVYSKKFNVNINAKVRRVVYNGLTDKNELVEVGTARRSLYDDVRDDFKKVETELQEGIDHAMTSANGKNTNYHGTADPNEIGLVGQNNDNYFRTNGQLKELWIYRNGMWHLEVGDLTGEQIRAEVEQAQQEIAEAKQTADEAVEQIDTAVVNAGFTSLDETISSVQTISNQAQINAGTAIDNALEAMTQASQAVDNTGSLNVRVGEVEDTLSIKADKQTVDDLTGVVDTQALDIKANADGLKLKANQDTVDLIDGRVSSLGTEVSAVAGQVNSRVWNTDIETAIDGIEVGGRNLFSVNQYVSLRNSEGTTHGNRYSMGSLGALVVGYVDGSGGYDTMRMVDLKANTEYIFTFNIPINDRFSFYDTDGVAVSVAKKWSSDNTQLTFKMGNVDGYIGGKFYPIEQSYPVEIYLMAEKGTIATDWTPAPEDTDAKIDHIETEWTQTFDSFSQTVSGIDGRVSKQEQTVSGMESVVYDPETGLSSLNTQLANLIQVAVTGEELSNAITISEQGILAQTVLDGEVVARINQEAGTTLIQNDKLYLDAETVAFSGKAFIPGAVIEDLSVDGAKIADATIGSAKIASLDVDKISGNKAQLVEAGFNGINRFTHLDADGIHMLGSGTYRRTYVTPTGFDLYNGSGGDNKAGAIGYFKETGHDATSNENYINSSRGSKHAIGIAANKGHNIILGYDDGKSINGFDRALQVDGDTGLIRLFSPITTGSSENYSMALHAGSHRGSPVIGWRDGGAGRGRIYLGQNVTYLESGNSTEFYAQSGRHLMTLRDTIIARENIFMDGNQITGTSDARLKTNIADTHINSLDEIKSWNFVDFEWIDDKQKGVQFGLLAQETSLVSEYDKENDLWSINMSKQVMVNSHAVQQLALKEENTNLLASENRTLIEKLQQENKELRNEIQKLKEAA